MELYTTLSKMVYHFKLPYLQGIPLVIRILFSWEPLG